ncbi:hypothetical protein K1T71_010021 [Dendrolimus kikuchii]|uniref:Uncharacterized protein n=1 Tax=Dendrolimus kikuchii TaxID=765133 RepID=A0ACC1CTN0_9NEOP|nr:hypothetical protein K1T71_010021 [Dendrolimus kikuchii]
MDRKPHIVGSNNWISNVTKSEEQEIWRESGDSSTRYMELLSAKRKQKRAEAGYVTPPSDIISPGRTEVIKDRAKEVVRTSLTPTSPVTSRQHQDDQSTMFGIRLGYYAWYRQTTSGSTNNEVGTSGKLTVVPLPPGLIPVVGPDTVRRERIRNQINRDWSPVTDDVEETVAESPPAKEEARLESTMHGQRFGYRAWSRKVLPGSRIAFTVGHHKLGKGDE